MNNGAMRLRERDWLGIRLAALLIRSWNISADWTVVALQSKGADSAPNSGQSDQEFLLASRLVFLLQKLGAKQATALMCAFQATEFPLWLTPDGFLYQRVLDQRPTGITSSWPAWILFGSLSVSLLASKIRIKSFALP